MASLWNSSFPPPVQKHIKLPGDRRWMDGGCWVLLYCFDIACMCALTITCQFYSILISSSQYDSMGQCNCQKRKPSLHKRPCVTMTSFISGKITSCGSAVSRVPSCVAQIGTSAGNWHVQSQFIACGPGVKPEDAG